MLSKAQVKLIKSLHTKKGRQKSGRCLVEGEKVVETAGEAIDFVFTRDDAYSDREFDELVTTQTPQDRAAVAHIPEWSWEQVQEHPVLVVLDGVQDPGNVGSMLRLCLGFGASLALIDSVDVANPKVIRSSVGALFQVPWVTLSRPEAVEELATLNRSVYRMERTGDGNASLNATTVTTPAIIVVGSEGNGITLPITGTSVAIAHDPALESLNAAHALAVALHQVYTAASR